MKLKSQIVADKFKALLKALKTLPVQVSKFEANQLTIPLPSVCIRAEVVYDGADTLHLGPGALIRIAAFNGTGCIGASNHRFLTEAVRAIDGWIERTALDY